MMPQWSELRVTPLAFVIAPGRVACPRYISRVVGMYPPHLFVIKMCMCLFVCYVLVVCLPVGVDPDFSKRNLS
jgi:hypothetical protein